MVTGGMNKVNFSKGIIIPILYFILLLFISHRHTLFIETDGAMQCLSSTEIASGQGYHGHSSHFWPPLYTILIYLFTYIFPDGFTAAKFISIISSSLLLLVVYRFLYRITGKDVYAQLAQLFVAVNPVYFFYSSQAQNMMLDTLFFVSAICLFFETLQSTSYKNFFLIGIIAGLAGLTRYTSYAIIPSLVLVLLFYYRPKIAFLNITMLLLGFVIVSLPWWIINTINSGGPINSLNYLNIGYGMAFQSGPEKERWWWHDQSAYNSTLEIILASPIAYIKHVLQGIVLVFFKLTVYSLLAFIGCLTLFFIQNIYAKTSKFIVISNKFFFVITICFLVYTGVISQAFILDRFLLNWYVIIIMAIFISLYTISGSTSSLRELKPVITWGLIVFLIANVMVSTYKISRYLSDNGGRYGLSDNEKIVHLLKTRDSHLSKKIIMAVHPARAYYLGCQYVMMPRYNEGSNANDLISYNHLDKKVIHYVPRFPSNLDIEKLTPDYFIFDRISTIYLPQFSFLLDEHSDKIPPNFERLLLTPDVAVYKIHK